jgi:putative RNA 2'-phosphotransferase
MDKNLIKKSRSLSKILRHDPQGLDMDKQGWVSVVDILHKLDLSLPDLIYIVENNDKSRFSFNEDNSKIRANQGHSIDVDLGLKPITPPEFLFHGTSKENWDKIQSEKSIKPMKRNHVHLSDSMTTATKVGSRKSHHIVVLKISSEQMHKSGYKFYKSENGVWLTDTVPIRYIT